MVIEVSELLRLAQLPELDRSEARTQGEVELEQLDACEKLPVP